MTTVSLYVADLEGNVSDSQLFDYFNQIGEVVSVRVCKDVSSRQSLGYAYVNFAKNEDAERAIKQLNFTSLNDKPIRIMYSLRDPCVRKSGAGNIFIKNLTKATDNKALHDTFSPFGTILSCKLATDPFGQSKGYGFVQYESEESAKKAIEKLNGTLLNNKQVFVGPFLPKRSRENNADNTKFTNVFVKNLSKTTTDEDLAKTFGQFGKTTSAVVMRDTDGKSKCFGFVNFEDADNAAKAVNALNGKKFDDMEWFVGKALKKSEREAELKQQLEQSKKAVVDKYQDSNLYIKNLDETIDDKKLRELFSRYGTIRSCKVMRDSNGVSKGTGFVAFSTHEEAIRALMEMRGKIIVSKPLFVSIAERKDERRARLQAHFSYMHPVAISPSGAPGMPMYHPGAAGPGQPVYYGQAPPVMIPAQPGFGYQRQLMPGVGGGAPVPNYFMPMIQPRPGQGRGPRTGGRHRGGAPGQQNQQPMPVMQQQMLPRGPYRYPPLAVKDAHIAGVPSAVFPQMRDPGSSSVPIGALATMLANATPEQQRMILGENLYPQVEELEPKVAGKVTGMLLEMDQTEVLHLLESPDALKAKIAEAMEVLRTATEQSQEASSSGSGADKFAGLSLTDK